MKRYIKCNSFNGYLYIFKHGIGPGTLPKDVTVTKEKSLPNGYTAVWLDRFLTTSELKQYDIPSETDINYYLDRIGYCQKDGDVIPCDEVLASSYIKSAREPKWWGSAYSCKVIDAYNKGKLTYKNMEEWETEYNGGFKPSNMGTKEILDYYIKTGKDPRDDIEACDKVTAASGIFYIDKGAGIGNINELFTEDDLRAAFNSLLAEGDPIATSYDSFDSWVDATLDSGLLSVEFFDEDVEEFDDEFDETDIDATTKPKYFANMVNASDDPDSYHYLVRGYYDRDRKGLAADSGADTLSEADEIINEYANQGYYIELRNMKTGTILEFSADNWFDEIYPDGGFAEIGDF